VHRGAVPQTLVPRGIAEHRRSSNGNSHPSTDLLKMQCGDDATVRTRIVSIIVLDAQVWRTQAMKFLSRLIREEDGQDMVEYALLAAFISIVAIVTIRNIGPLINAIYVRVQNALT
jgi:pilus assembly protein Flp/PilA